MHFVIACTDKADHLNVRMDNRPDHVAYLKSHADKIVAAGPTLGDSAEQMTGSVLIMEFDTLADAEDWAKNDPYAIAGLFQDVSIKPWKKVFPA
jgi:uncharacterized protein YciI